MGPIHVPFGTGCAKIRNFSISKTLAGVDLSERVVESKRSYSWSGWVEVSQLNRTCETKLSREKAGFLELGGTNGQVFQPPASDAIQFPRGSPKER